MPVRVPLKLQRRRKGHDGVVILAFETPSIFYITGRKINRKDSMPQSHLP